MKTYRIIRFYLKSGRRRVIAKGLTPEQARTHCCNPQTSWITCTTSTGKRRTKRLGKWYDGMEWERKRAMEWEIKHAEE